MTQDDIRRMLAARFNDGLDLIALALFLATVALWAGIFCRAL